MMQLSDGKGKEWLEYLAACIQKGINQKLDQIELNGLKRCIHIFGEILRQAAQNPEQCNVSSACTVISVVIAAIIRVRTTNGIQGAEETQGIFYTNFMQNPECHRYIVLFLIHLNFHNGDCLLCFRYSLFITFTNQKVFNIARTRMVGIIQRDYLRNSLLEDMFMFMLEKTFNIALTCSMYHIKDTLKLQEVGPVIEEEEEEEEEEVNEPGIARLREEFGSSGSYQRSSDDSELEQEPTITPAREEPSKVCSSMESSDSFDKI
jgi:hypothetical protein